MATRIADATQRRVFAIRLLKEDHERSDRLIAELSGLSHPTVGKIRKSLESLGEIPERHGEHGGKRDGGGRRRERFDLDNALKSIQAIKPPWPDVVDRDLRIALEQLPTNALEVLAERADWASHVAKVALTSLKNRFHRE